MGEYKRINCDFYDHFEIFASRKTWVYILLKDGSEFNTRIKTLETSNKEEFAILNSGRKIRLDVIEELAELKAKDQATWRVLDMIDYDRWANEVVLSILEANQPSEEISSRVSHIINAQNIWLDRIGDKHGEYDVWQLRQSDSWSGHFEDNYQKFMISLEAESTDKIINYHNLAGKKYSTILGDILHHVVNHGTYHRGQIMDMIRHLGIPTKPTDYIYYVRLRR